MSASQDSWKDETWTLTFIALIFACFIPALQPYIADGFKFLREDCPEWLTYGILASTLQAWPKKHWQAEGLDADMKLSKNFSLREMTKSQTALRMGISNTPTIDKIQNLKALCENVLQPVRDHYDWPVTITSGYRCEELCQAIRSKATSQHALGQAADFEIAGISNYGVAEWIAKHCVFDQLILEFYTGGNTGWVH